MKKLSSYILLALLILNIFTPFSIALDKTSFVYIKKSVAEAGDISVSIKQEETTENSMRVKFEIGRTETVNHEFAYLITDKYGSVIINTKQLKEIIEGVHNGTLLDSSYIKEASGAKRIKEGKISLANPTVSQISGEVYTTDSFYLKDLTPNSKYYITYIAYSGNTYADMKTGTKLLQTTAAKTDTNNESWAYLNMQKQYQGPFNSKTECEKALSDYLNNPANGITAEGKVGKVCTQQTAEDIKKSQVLRTPNQIAQDQAQIEDLSKNDVPVGDPNTYNLLAPIGGLKEVKTDSIGDYFNTIFKIAIGLCGALAVIMIVIGGVQYMGDESVFGKTEAKSKIMSAILGLLIALGAFALLNTIDPALTGKNGLNVDQVTAEIQAIEYIPTKTYENITGIKKLSPSEYDVLGRKVAKQVGIPFCAIKVILERESRGDPGAIGFDENVRNSAIPSRVAFVNSGKKYNGETFTPSTDLIKKSGFINQSKSNVTKTPGLGLDWRFSKGLGLTQITLFPSNYFSEGYKKNPPNLGVSFPMYKGFTPQDLLNPEKNLTAGSQIWKDSWIKCGKDIYKTWSAYGSGSCVPNSDFIRKEATIRTHYYNGCSSVDKSV